MRWSAGLLPSPLNGYPGFKLLEASLGVISTVFTGMGSPEGVVVSPVGGLYTRKDGGSGTTLYVKESGVGNTGWIAK